MVVRGGDVVGDVFVRAVGDGDTRERPRLVDAVLLGPLDDGLAEGFSRGGRQEQFADEDGQVELVPRVETGVVAGAPVGERGDGGQLVDADMTDPFEIEGGEEIVDGSEAGESGFGEPHHERFGGAGA